jgi:hypothetical protein
MSADTDMVDLKACPLCSNGFHAPPDTRAALDASGIGELVEALEEARQIIAAMPISEMVGRNVGENKVRTYEEARGIFVRSLSNTDAALSRARATVGNKDG